MNVCGQRTSYAGRRFASAPKDDYLTTRTDARIGVRGNVAVCRLANTVTFCDGHGVFFVAVSGQFREGRQQSGLLNRISGSLHTGPEFMTSSPQHGAPRTGRTPEVGVSGIELPASM